MRNMILGAILAAGLGATGAHATTKANCQVIAPPMNQASLAFSTMYASMQNLNFQTISTEFTGEERAQFIKMADIHDRLLPVFEEYLTELETLGLMMKRCAR